jgi:hypothetical protein
MKFTVRHVFDTDQDTYWERVFFDPEYNRRLYLEALGFKSFELLEMQGGPGELRTRKIRIEPKSDAPPVVQKLVGGSLTYIEEGRWDPSSRIWTYKIATSKLADKLHIGGTFWVEPRGDKKIERFCEVQLEVRIFGVGSIVEGFIEKTTRENYEEAARFTSAYIRERGLSG